MAWAVDGGDTLIVSLQILAVVWAGKGKEDDEADQRQHGHDEDAPLGAGESAAEDRLADRVRGE